MPFQKVRPSNAALGLFDILVAYYGNYALTR